MTKNILFIAPSYFGIQEKIKRCLEEQGYQVFYINDSNNSFFNNIIRKIPYIEKEIRSQKRKKIEKIVQNNSIDTLFVIRGSQLGYNDWCTFFEHTNIPQKIMYQWDSVRNYNYIQQVKFYDKVITFDRKDSIEYNLSYFPLFWEKSRFKEDKKECKDIDLLFVGIWHSDRTQILNQVFKQAKENGLRTYIKVFYPFYLYIWLRYVKKIKINSSFLTFKSVSPSKMDTLYHKAKCIIDINHPSQTGLTMRTMETIGHGKKLLTTNSYIQRESFYNEDNIVIINRDNIKVDFSFLEKQSDYINIEKYELRNWLNCILTDDF